MIHVMLYRNVLLLDFLVVNWKTGHKHWGSVDEAFTSSQFVSLMSLDPSRFTVFSDWKIVTTEEEYREFFEDTTWYRQFAIHEDYKDKIWLPYEEIRS